MFVWEKKQLETTKMTLLFVKILNQIYVLSKGKNQGIATIIVLNIYG